MSETRGLNHLGLSVAGLDRTTAFFTDLLGWQETARDPTYLRATVTEGNIRLTLWQVDHGLEVGSFDRRGNIGLHHLALEVDTEARLDALAATLQAAEDVQVEFHPEPVGSGPRKHMMCCEPGGIRVELIWPGN